MTVAARTILIIIAIAVTINFLQGGPGRVARWGARTLTGRDLLGST